VEEVSTEGETQQDEESIGRNEDDLVTIGIFWNGANAAIAQQYLVSMGIEAFVMDDVTANMLSFTGMFSVRVQVPGHQAEMARKLLEEQQEFALEDGLDGEFADGASDGGEASMELATVRTTVIPMLQSSGPRIMHFRLGSWGPCSASSLQSSWPRCLVIPCWPSWVVPLSGM